MKFQRSAIGKEIKLIPKKPTDGVARVYTGKIICRHLSFLTVGEPKPISHRPYKIKWDEKHGGDPNTPPEAPSTNNYEFDIQFDEEITDRYHETRDGLLNGLLEHSTDDPDKRTTVIQTLRNLTTHLKEE